MQTGTKKKVLILLQNAFHRAGACRMKIPAYDISFCNRKNATYSRIIPYLEPHFELWFAECTNLMSKDNKTKFPTKLDWVKSALDQHDWYAVIAFSSQAHKALEDLEYEPFAKLPHPVSYKWRKALIEETVQKLLESGKDI